VPDPLEPTPLLSIEGLAATGGGSPILRGVDLTVAPGELHAIMGPNGSGKSTFAHVLAGDPEYTVTGGTITFRGEEITDLPADTRAKLGIFLAFQDPMEVPGVPVSQFLRQAVAQRRGRDVSVLEIRVQIREWLDRLGLDRTFGERHLNDGFSGGEKKRNEILQMALLEPELAILDETDSGLDVDGLRVVARGIDEVRRARPDLGIIVVTHYERILTDLRPDVIHILIDGRIVASGDFSLAARLEAEGYEPWRT
jgi:Fe-S cluster assembly ATP-binding protein